MCYLFIILLTNADTEKKKNPKKNKVKLMPHQKKTVFSSQKENCNCLANDTNLRTWLENIYSRSTKNMTFEYS